MNFNNLNANVLIQIVLNSAFSLYIQILKNSEGFKMALILLLHGLYGSFDKFLLF